MFVSATRMLKLILISVCFLLAACAASPTDRIIRKLDPGYRYQYAEDSDGKLHLVDLWMPLSDLPTVARFNPQSTNVYHLFTRSNPSRSQPLLFNNANLLQESNYDSSKRTIMLIHGWRNSASSDFNMALIPVLLAAADVNVIVVDWSAGADSIIYRIVNWNSITSGEAVAKFIDWVNQLTGSSLAQFHIIGHGVGGHQAGVVGRNVNGQINYITGLDPALIGWVNNIDRFSPNDALYTEVIHTNYGMNGYLADLAQVDFYPNGGISMPGCDSNECDHARSFFYFAESITSGGFTGRECLNYYAAVLRMCDYHSGRLQMGGLTPKVGKTGVYYLETNPSPPFSQG